ncbi:MAG TPA: AraC family transcriptional regulator, partial [Bacilli bacterium]
ENHPNQFAVEPDSDDPLTIQAAIIIQEQAYEFISLKRLADSLGLNPVQFTRRFQSAYHITPSQYLKNIRMHRARSLLTETDLTLDQIAGRCGYENGFYLSRVFSQTMKMSPSQYRRTHQV